MLIASPRVWTAVAYGYGALVVAVLAYFLYDMPIQLTDGFTNMVDLPGRTLGGIIYDQLFQTAYLRPLLWGHLQILFAAADGQYFEWFRGWHVVQVTLLVTLFISLLRPRSMRDAAVVPLGLAALLGIHTFAGTVEEAFPVNTFMTVLLCCLAAAKAALGPYRWWRDVAVLLLFAFAALTVESGLLVFVVVAAAYVTGARGVSRGALAALIILLAAYCVLRFVILDVGGPGLIERSSGYGFSMLDPDALIARFGEQPSRFYAYNVATSIVSVLSAEPRAGVWAFVRGLAEHDLRPYQIVNVVASVLGTVLIAGYAWRRRAAWSARRFDDGDRLVLLFIAVLGANAVISYPYTKDVIMSPAGVFYALALSVAVRHLLAEVPATRLRAVVTVLVLAVVAGSWAMRATGLHFGLRISANKVRNEWAYVDQWYAREGRALTGPAQITLKRQLQEDAVFRHPVRPMPESDWLEYLEID